MADTARIPRAQYAKARHLIQELDGVLHNTGGDHASVIETAHRLAHEIAHLTIELDDPSHSELHPEHASATEADPCSIQEAEEAQRRAIALMPRRAAEEAA